MKCNTTINIVILIYHIKKELLLVIKKQYDYDNHLVEREIENYKRLNKEYPLFPFFFGTNKKGHIFIEYINGQTLSNIKELKLNNDEKTKIIKDIAKSLTFLHLNNFIYRDLKPNNVIITDKKVPILIDFDRMIHFNVNKENTIDSSSIFLAPELQNNISIHYESDSYSLGQMIYYIHTEKVPTSDEKNLCHGIDPKIIRTWKIFTAKDYRCRPSIAFLSQFNDNIKQFIQKSLNNPYFDVINGKIKRTDVKTDDPYILQTLAVIYFMMGDDFTSNNLLVQSAEKGSLFSLSLLKSSSKQKYNIIENEFEVTNSFDDSSYIYFADHYIIVERDVKKASKYLSKVENKNVAQYYFLLGLILIINNDFKNAIEYIKTAESKNNYVAYILLSIIYFDGIKVFQDKSLVLQEAKREPWFLFSLSISYFSYIQEVDFDLLPANYQKYLRIYFESIKKDEQFFLKKVIECLNLSAKENDEISKKCLLMIHFLSNEMLNIADIQFIFSCDSSDLSFNFFRAISLKLKLNGLLEIINNEETLEMFAANFSDVVIHSYLCYFYFVKKFNFEKAFYYGTLACNQKDNLSSLILGMIYFIRELINDDIYLLFRYADIFNGMLLGILNKNFPFDMKRIDFQKKFFSNIYLKIWYIQRDKSKAVHLLRIAAQDKSLNMVANFCLNLLFLNENDASIAFENYPFGLYIKEEFFKGAVAFRNYGITGNQNQLMGGIQFLTEGAKNKDMLCNFILGMVNIEGIGLGHEQNLDKAISYLSFSANQYTPYLYYQLAIVYEKKGEIKKSLENYLYAAEKGSPDAQYVVGSYYLKGKCMLKQNIKKGIDFLRQSSKNKKIEAIFALGYLYLVGCEYEIKQCFNMSVGFFKTCSNLVVNGHKYSLNNLGIIYKNGYGGFSDLTKAIQFFKEAIKLSKYIDPKTEMYNLAHLLLYNDNLYYEKKDKKKEAINLLIHSSYNFEQSKELLCIALICKYGSNIKLINIQNEINDISKDHKFLLIPHNLADNIWYKIKREKLNEQTNFNKKYEELRHIDYLYDFPSFKPFISNEILNGRRMIIELKPDLKIKEINSLFYEGLNAM